ncbi:hypothetical protein B5S31_g4939 [[Candida] boidinii]|nr:hypothetical protein B5S31_g4939 [[Candida] boidinii]GME77646.1 unnamed protein product [[Candida] boidinii]
MFSRVISSSVKSIVRSVPNQTRLNSTVVKLEFPPSLLNLRIGKIIDIKRHENADKLYVSQIQIEESSTSESNSNENSEIIKPKTLQVCSGLVDYIPSENLLNSRVVLLTNLKPSKMRGVKSEAMLLAASSENKIENTEESKIQVEVVRPPLELPLGTLMYFKGFKPQDPFNISRIKGKAWDNIVSFLKTNSNLEVSYNKSDCILVGDKDNTELAAKVETLANSPVH